MNESLPPEFSAPDSARICSRLDDYFWAVRLHYPDLPADITPILLARVQAKIALTPGRVSNETVLRLAFQELDDWLGGDGVLEAKLKAASSGLHLRDAMAVDSVSPIGVLPATPAATITPMVPQRDWLPQPDVGSAVASQERAS